MSSARADERPRPSLAAMLAFAALALVLLAVLGGLVAYLGWRVVEPLALPPAAHWLGWALLIWPLLGMPLAMLAERLAPVRWLRPLIVATHLALAWLSFVLVLTLLRDLGFAAAGLFGWLGETTVLPLSSVAVVVLALLATGFGVVRALAPPRSVEIELPIEGLHPDLDGFRLAQLSDVHLGATVPRRLLARAVEQVNALQPDLVAITGDLADGTVARWGADAAPLADLQAPAYFVDGNHDWFYERRRWLDLLTSLGVTVLEQDHRVQVHGEARLLVAGVTDLSMGRRGRLRSDPLVAAAEAPDTDLCLLLAHQPRSAIAAAEAGFDLQLSGHTHNGQFWPWTWVVRLVMPFAHGLHRHRNLWIYTTTGIGYWGPPVRVGAPPEIPLIHLRRSRRWRHPQSLADPLLEQFAPRC